MQVRRMSASGRSRNCPALGNIAWHRRNVLGDPKILEALVLIGEPDANPAVEATWRIGRLVETVEGIAAAAELDHRAHDFGIVRTTALRGCQATGQTNID